MISGFRQLLRRLEFIGTNTSPQKRRNISPFKNPGGWSKIDLFKKWCFNFFLNFWILSPNHWILFPTPPKNSRFQGFNHWWFFAGCIFRETGVGIPNGNSEAAAGAKDVPLALPLKGCPDDSDDDKNDGRSKICLFGHLFGMDFFASLFLGRDVLYIFLCYSLQLQRVWRISNMVRIK